jgi:CxxC-x17-CxxC domain-containing protein
MYKAKRDARGGSGGGWKGGKKFGGKKPWERGSDGRSDKPFMHKAMCDACGKSCQVPFVPNGSKPVLCSFCFNKDEKPRRFDRSDRPSGHRDDSNVQEQLKAMNAKIDTILRLLKSGE